MKRQFILVRKLYFPIKKKKEVVIDIFLLRNINQRAFITELQTG